MSTAGLSEFFASNAECDSPLVLASVFSTGGATYSKTGAFMLINGAGLFQGMLSGGCLEGDLAERARQVAADGLAQRVTYDLSQNDEDLWGLGVGCDGQMRIFLQPLLAGDKYEPLASMLHALQGDDVEVIAIVIESTSVEAPAGASLVSSAGSYRSFGLQPAATAILEAATEGLLSDGRSTTRSIRINGAEVSVLFALLKPPPKVLVLGAGLDAEPVLSFCAELGWRVTVIDHRPAYIEKGNFAGAQRVLCCPADSLAATVDLHRFDAHRLRDY
jgi:xanthine/CO dehydrogenase XdhC/CoxF family maturation factor